MPVKLRIPSPLRRFTDSRSAVDISAPTVRAALDELVGRYQDLRRHLFDEQGDLRRFVNIYVNGEDIRQLQGMATPLADGDEVMIIPSIAGGAPGSDRALL
ncbi:MAG: MoaD/ThiS family protein [Acidobacteria bacterium]|nr:MoaD/ThiS family protein [Acidobacteriota bacterium]